MKLSKYIILGAAGALGLMTSCDDWLDVNVNPNTPTDVSAKYNVRLAHVQHYAWYANQIAGQASTMVVGDYTSNTRTSSQGLWAQWQLTEWCSTTCYQFWFVGSACNLEQLIKTAEADQAWHYVGAAYLIRAYGYSLMNDLYGEMPYDDATSSSTNPEYNNGKEMYQYILEDLDKAIEYLSMTQPATAAPLAANDTWGNGDASKWLKAAYLLKARHLNHLTRKGAGKIADLKWDADEILACLDKAQQSNADNMIVAHKDVDTSSTDFLWSENTEYSPLYSVFGMNSNYYFTRKVFDNLTNFCGLGIEDPRADHILPWARSAKSVENPNTIDDQKIKWSEDGKWRRTVGLDMNTLIRTQAAPYTTSWDKVNGRFICNSKNNERLGDTIFIHQKSGSIGYGKGINLLDYADGQKGAGDEKSATSGTFYTRASSPGQLATYAEACFIRAEVLMRRGQNAAAFDAYKKGIEANIRMMNDQLQSWASGDKTLQSDCPSFVPMTEESIQNFLNNGIGNAGNISLAKIMTQKGIAMMYSPECWNDMRRYDFDENIFLNFHKPAEWAVNSGSQLAIPAGKFPRRIRVSSHEYRYNNAQLNAIGAEVYGANTSAAGGNWWNENDMWTIPVWWDNDQP